MSIRNFNLIEFQNAIFTGVTIGIGSQIMIFSSNAQILIQCAFVCDTEGVRQFGHGEEIDTCKLFFPFLNEVIRSIEVIDDLALKISFENEDTIVVTPEPNGLESYVVTTQHGIQPVIASGG